MRENILSILERDSRIKPSQIAIMLNTDEKTISEEIDKMIEERIICGHTTLVDWSKTEREYVTALIEVRVTPQRGQGFDKIAERIYKFDEVKSVYLMSGGFDLTIIIEGKNIKDIAYFVSDKLSPLESILSTATHFVLKKYKDNGIIFDKKPKMDERMIVSP